MIAPPPVTRGDQLERARDRVRRELGLAAADPAPADGLIRIFARLAEIAAARIDGALEKNLLAFLDLVGVRQAAPRAARATLTFTAAEGAPDAVRVPAGTAAAAPPAAGDADPVLFETERELVLTTAALVAAWVREPSRDRIADLGAGDGHDPFAGERVPVRRLLIGCGPLAALGPRQRISVSPAMAGANTGWLGAVSWSWWDGAAWHDVVPTTGSGAATAVLDVPEVPLSEIGGHANRWLAATLATPIPHVGLEWDSALGSRVTSVSGVLDAAFADDDALDVGATFAPFGPAAAASAFVLAFEDAFGKPGARVTLSAVPVAGAATADDPPPILAWQYFDGQGWKDLVDAVDDTVGLTAPGDVEFTVPPGWGRVAWPPGATDGRVAHWLRARLRSGAIVGAPRLATLTVTASWALPRVASVAVGSRAERTSPGLAADAALSGGVAVDATVDFLPFGAQPAPGSILHLACDEALTPPPAVQGISAGVAIAVKLTSVSTASTAPTAKLVWEYWDTATGNWKALGESTAAGTTNATNNFSDGTKAFTADGTVSFNVPATLGAVPVAGELRRWLRVRVATGDYGHEARYTKVDNTGFTLDPANLAPPSIASVRFTYARATTAPLAAELVVEADSARTLPERGADGAFEPFPPMTDADPALHLGFSAPLPNVAVTLYADADQEVERGGALPAPSVAWEYWDGDRWAALGARDETRGLTRAGLVTFVGPADLTRREDFGAAAWWLRARREPRATPAARGLLRRLRTNTTWASEGSSVVAETLGSSTAEPGLRLAVTRPPVLDGETLEVLEPDLPPPAELAALGPGAVTAQDASGASVRWVEVTDFITSGPRDRHYALDRVAGVVSFGDGRRGLVPPAGRANVRMSYRSGGGARGNRRPGEIAQLTTAVPYVDAVTNHEPATGGSDAESLASVRERGPRMLRHGGRAVAAVDLEDLAGEAAPAVARMLAIPTTGAADAGLVGVVVVPAGIESRPDPGAALLAEVRSHLEARLPATAELWVTGPGWVEVTVSAVVTPVSLDAAGEVQSAAAERLAAFLHPLTGGPRGIGWPFGRVPHESDLIAVLEALAGVDHVERLSLDRRTLEPAPATGAFLVTSGRHEITMAVS